jgi:ppGpp synthetase/RelA/SpoT-type nucleotidyltranferase
MSEHVNTLLEQYRLALPHYEAFADRVEHLIRTLLDFYGVRFHTLTTRVKDVKSLQGKLLRPGKRYENLRQVTDLVGVRIITHYVHEVDVIGSVIEREFSIDPANSVDKRQLEEHDRFGYASLHKVCGLSDSRLALPEYMHFRGLVCEIQIRTILQHAWAEIEHDLGYKSTIAIPRYYRRGFARLSALLEMADIEFYRLGRDLVLQR